MTNSIFARASLTATWLVLTFGSWLGSSSLHAQALTGVTVSGTKRTQQKTLLELLPREPPAAYSDAELAEAERRISNLAVFDRAVVMRRPGEVAIEVSEKWTLIPEVSFATGKTLEDLYISLGASEYNLAGTASMVGLSVYREQRGFGFLASFREHESRHHRWAMAGEASYGSAGLRFPDGNGWYVNTGHVSVWATSTPLWGQHLRGRTYLSYSHERMDDVDGTARPPDGHALETGAELVWDAYRFHDLVPRGLKAALVAGPGIFVPARQLRAYVELSVQAAQPLAAYTVLTARATGIWVNRGNANHSALLGSIEGVRGLDDALYRNWAQAYANVELRQAIPLLERLALQVVAFADAGLFAEFDAEGAHAGAGTALGSGLGARLIPTFLAQLLLRVDVARLILPRRDWFVQLGLSQYF